MLELVSPNPRGAIFKMQLAIQRAFVCEQSHRNFSAVRVPRDNNRLHHPSPSLEASNANGFVRVVGGIEMGPEHSQDRGKGFGSHAARNSETIFEYRADPGQAGQPVEGIV